MRGKLDQLKYLNGLNAPREPTALPMFDPFDWLSSCTTLPMPPKTRAICTAMLICTKLPPPPKQPPHTRSSSESVNSQIASSVELLATIIVSSLAKCRHLYAAG